MAIRGCRGRSGGKGVSRVPKERRALGDCVRQLFTTISLNRPRLPPVPAAFVSRNLRDRRVSTYRDLGCSLSGLFSVACDETHPLSPSVRPAASSCAASCEVLRQRRVFTSLRSHNSGRQTGKPFFLPLSFSFPSSFSCSCFYSATAADFPGSYTPPLFMQSP